AVTVKAVLARDTPWGEAGHVVAWGQRVLAAVEPRANQGGLPEPVRLEPVRPELERPEAARAHAPSSITHDPRLGRVVFDGRTGRLKRWGELELDVPWLDLHRAPTENDHGQGDLNDIASVWHATGLDRLLHRTDAIEQGEGWLRVAGRTAPASHPHGVYWTMLWRADDRGLVLSVAASFVGPWSDTPFRRRDIWVPRLGLLFALPGGYQTVEWYGRGPGETYVDSFEGSRIGAFATSIDGLQVHYPVPQENGNHVQTRRLVLRGAGLGALRVDGMPTFDFTARRWTSLDLQNANKPHELVDSGTVWLNVDHAQQGIGSASVGPALPERYRIPRERTRWSVRLQLA
ncbi:MAG: glycoside hydrolase family 2 TIM barrel-domain containing protein, partial [Humibacter sp.]